MRPRGITLSEYVDRREKLLRSLKGAVAAVFAGSGDPPQAAGSASVGPPQTITTSCASAAPAAFDVEGVRPDIAHFDVSP